MDEDMILPDDFETDTTPTEETLEPEQDTIEPETVEDTTPTEPEPSEPAPPQTIKIKVDHQDREISVDEAATLAQKGLNYDRAVERARQEAADAVIASMGLEWEGKPIKTEAEYKRALAEQELIQKYKDVPEELRNEIIENRKFREQYEADKKSKAEQEAKDADLKGFLDYFQSVNDRPFDPTKDTIPKEVWEANSKGTPLRFAYAEHHNKELQNQLKMLKQNQKNQEKAPVGSTTAHGSVESASEDAFMEGFNSV